MIMPILGGIVKGSVIVTVNPIHIVSLTHALRLFRLIDQNLAIVNTSESSGRCIVNGAISDQAIQTLYNEQLRLAKTSEEIRVRLILSRTKPEADAVIGILGQGASFEAVAMERSIDEATRFSGGDLGYSTLDVMPQAYAGALRDKPAGSTVGPFQTEGGWAVLRVEDRRKENPPTLEHPLVVIDNQVMAVKEEIGDCMNTWKSKQLQNGNNK